VLAAMLADKGTLTAADLALAVAQGDPHSVQLIRDCGRRVGQVLASLVSFFNPGMIVVGGRVTGLGHSLLAEIRGVTYRRSFPLATGNLPIVLGELGDATGVIGCARLVSTTVYAPPGDEGR
jgi:predicted NBD/HSP70 family sugar kinase